MYAYVHHGNTKKIVEEIARVHEVKLVDATRVEEEERSGYNLIEFVSEIYYGKFH